MRERREITGGWWGTLIRLNNGLTRLRRVRVAPENLLLLVPHCLHFTRCAQDVRSGINQCRRCGQCDIAGLLAIRDRYGILLDLAGGGRQALSFLRDPAVKAVVAVACEQELADGIRAAFPKPVLGVPNTRPNGACKDTRVALDAVEAAVTSLLGRNSAAAQRPTRNR